MDGASTSPQCEHVRGQSAFVHAFQGITLFCRRPADAEGYSQERAFCNVRFGNEITERFCRKVQCVRGDIGYEHDKKNPFFPGIPEGPVLWRNGAVFD